MIGREARDTVIIVYSTTVQYIPWWCFVVFGLDSWKARAYHRYRNERISEAMMAVASSRRALRKAVTQYALAPRQGAGR